MSIRTDMPSPARSPAHEDAAELLDARLVPRLPLRMHGAKLLFRSHGEEICVKSNSALSAMVFEHCDGHRSVADILQTCSPEVDEATVLRFLGDLVRARLLVREDHWLLDQWALVHDAPPPLHGSGTNHTQTSFVPTHFSATTLSCANGSGDIDLAMIEHLLRTLEPSLSNQIDAVSIKSQLIVARKHGHLSKGIYQLAGDDRNTRLETVHPQHFDDFHRAFYDLSSLTADNVYVCLSANLEQSPHCLGHHTLPSLYLRAGQLVERLRAALAPIGCILTVHLDADFRVIEGSLGQDDLKILVLTSIHPSVEEKPAPTRPPVVCRWLPKLPDSTLFVINTKVEKTGGAFNAFGYAPDPQLAHAKAVSEAIERHAYCQPADVFPACATDLADWVDPTRLMKYSEQQYADKRFPCQRFSSTQRYHWKAGDSLSSGRRVYVLSDLIYAPSSLTSFGMYDQLFRSTSSGCAAHPHRETAIITALLELIERHALMAMWFRQSGGQLVDNASLPGAIAFRINVLERHGFSVSVQLLDTHYAPAVCIFAVHLRKGGLVTGSGAGFHLDAAIESALNETEIAALSWETGLYQANLIKDARAVQSGEDHRDLYLSRTCFRRATRCLRVQGEGKFSDLAKLSRNSSDTFLERCSDAGAIIIDLQREAPCTAGTSESGSVVRAFLPGLIPMAFGWACQPFGMTSHIARGGYFPHPFS